MAWAKKSSAGGLDKWAWNEIKALPLAWFSGLAILLYMVESTAVWPQGLLDANIAVIPDSFGSASSVCAACYLSVVGLSQGNPFEGLG